MNAPPGDAPLLSLCDLHCQRGGRSLFTGLQLSLRAGELMELRGANGSGKTTLLRMAAGLFRDFEGAVRRRGAPCYLGHRPGLKQALSPRQNLAYFCALHEIDPGGIDASLEELGLRELADTPCVQLSAGQRQRVALARLGLSRAGLWLLDEPFAGLDGGASEVLQRMLARHADQGGGALVSVHGTGAVPSGLQTRPLVFSSLPSPPASCAAPAPGRNAPSLLHGFLGALRRDLRLLFRERNGLLRPAFFFLAAVMLFALGRGIQTAFPVPAALSALWVAALLATVLAGDELCRGDLEDGSLDLLLTAPTPAWVPALARILASWLGVVLPLALLAPVAALLLSLPAAPTLWLSLLSGGIALSALGVTGGALTAGASTGGGLLLGQLFLPLALPILIFGVATAEAALGGFPWLPPFSLLSALSLGALLLLPAATAEGWRIAAEQ